MSLAWEACQGVQGDAGSSREGGARAEALPVGSSGGLASWQRNGVSYC